MKIISLSACLLLVCLFCQAQKMTRESITLQYTIDPVQPLPADLSRYKAVLITPINPLTYDDVAKAEAQQTSAQGKIMAAKRLRLDKIAALERTYLGVANKPLVSTDEDATVTLTTGKVTVININPKPFSQIGFNEEIFRYRVMAALEIKDNSGKVRYSKTISDSTTERPVYLSGLYSDPIFAAFAAMRSDEKIKSAYESFIRYNQSFVLLEVMMKADRALTGEFETQSNTSIVAVFGVKGKPYAEIATTNDALTTALGKFRALSKKNRIPKEELDKIFASSLVVWEKYLANKQGLEEKAVKGLALNCALASAWTGDFDKADKYMAEVPEVFAAKKAIESGEDDDGPPPSSSMGAVVILSLEEYAANMYKLVQDLKSYPGRLQFVQ